MYSFSMASTFKLLFVCLGNICRSPCAEGVMRKLVIEAGLADQIIIDSAGTADWHTGKLPDDRMRRHAKQRGYALESRARQAQSTDLADFDLILAMDKTNHGNLLTLCRSPEQRAKLRLFCEFAENRDEVEVPDPYYGGAEGFEEVLDIVEDGCAGILEYARQQLALAT
jgi:protein-tyrosine phosphatase